MANDRMYLINREQKAGILLAKSDGYRWNPFHGDLFKRLETLLDGQSSYGWEIVYENQADSEALEIMGLSSVIHSPSRCEILENPVVADEIARHEGEELIYKKGEVVGAWLNVFDLLGVGQEFKTDVVAEYDPKGGKDGLTESGKEMLGVEEKEEMDKLLEEANKNVT